MGRAAATRRDHLARPARARLNDDRRPDLRGRRLRGRPHRRRKGRSHGVGVHPVPRRGGDDRAARQRDPCRTHGIGRHRRRADRARRSEHRRHGAGRRARRSPGGVDRRRARRARQGPRQGQRVVGHVAREPRRLRRVVRRRRDELRAELGGADAVAAARRRLGVAGQGAVPPADPIRRRRPHDRARGPAADVAVLPGTDRSRPAAVRRVRRPPLGARTDRVRRRAGASRWRC